MAVVYAACCLNAPDIHSYFIWHVPLVCTVIHDLTFLCRFTFPWSPYIYICMRTDVHIHAFIYVYMYIYIYVYMYIHICIYIYVYTNLCTYINMYT